MKRLAAFFIALVLVSALPVSAEPELGIDQSVVRIVNYTQRGNWFAPWDTTPVRSATGSGFVIAGGLVMTNAHVVSDSRMLLIFLNGDPKPHQAEVVVVGHDCDLALIKPQENGLLDQIPALAFGPLPALRSTVETYGYPAGGQQISSTRGVVSRIEMQLFAHSGLDSHLAVQTDAAINPGNSGGPVVQAGKVVGVAFQGAGDLENVGYFISTDVTRHFLDDFADGRYDGFPELGVSTTTLENPAARRRAGMVEGESGVIVEKIYPETGSVGVIQPGDILLEIGGKVIANDGTIADGGLRQRYAMVVERLQAGQTVSVKVLRAGKKLPLEVTVGIWKGGAKLANAFDRQPRYFVYAGLVFVPLEREVLKVFGNEWNTKADKALIYEHLFRTLEDPGLLGKERIVLLRRLDHPVNIKIPWFRNDLVERVNGQKIESLEDLVRAIEGNKGPFQTIEMTYFGRIVVIDREQAEKANPEIAERYGIQKDRRL